MKEYLAKIVIPGTGIVVHIAYYADTPSKNYRIYSNGMDLGYRYEYLGNAVKYLEKMANLWDLPKNQCYYYTKDLIPRRGSNA